jgi:peroxiredoxin
MRSKLHSPGPRPTRALASAAPGFLLLAFVLCIAALAAADLPRRAPGFALPDSKMKVYDLYDYRGKIVVLEFMKTDCPHCAAFATVLGKVQAKFGEKVQILSVVNMQQDNDRTVAAYIVGHNITYPLLFDAGQMAYSYVLKPELNYPQVFVIDAHGMIQRQYDYGPMSRDIFEGNGLIAEIERVMAASAAKK